MIMFLQAPLELLAQIETLVVALAVVAVVEVIILVGQVEMGVIQAVEEEEEVLAHQTLVAIKVVMVQEAK